MTIAEVRRVTGADLHGDPGAGDACVQSSLAQDPGIVFMFEKGRLARIDLADAHHETIRRLRVGETEQRARAQYAGRFEETAHKYVRGGRYLTVRSGDGRDALVVETDGRFVTRVRAGRFPAVAYVEGCQ